MRRRRQLLQVSTCPFLAVLLCAMGSLILLLLVIDRRAKVVARTKALLAASRVADEEAQAAESRRAEWERRRQCLHQQLVQEDENVLAEVRAVQTQTASMAQALQTKRAEVGEQEARVRAEQARLAEWDERIMARRAELARAEKQTEASQAEMARLTADLLRLERTLADLKAARQRQQQMYSVVPYHGKHGDNRRPLYVECTADGLVFHPDQLVLRDLTRTPAEIRAEIERRLARRREEMTVTRGMLSRPGSVSNDGQEREGRESMAPNIAVNQELQETPYLLMLVRPEGITTYYRALAALQEVKIDFGYEFIDRDWVLDFSQDTAPSRTQPRMVVARTDGSAKAQRPSTGSPVAHASAGAAAPMGYRGTTPVDGVAASPAGKSLPAGRGHPASQGGLVGTQSPSSGGPASSAAGAARMPGLASGDNRSSTDGLALGGPVQPAAVHGLGGSVGIGHPRPIPADSTGSPTLEPKFGNRSGGSPAETVPEKQTPRSGGGSPTPRVMAGPPDSGGPPVPEPGGPGPGVARKDQTPEVSGEPKTGLPPDPLARLAQSKGGRAVPLRPGLLNVNRDWIIQVECKADALVISATGQRVALAELARNENGSNPLLDAVQHMIARRETTLRSGEPLYRPMIRFRVWPDGLRSYYAAYPALEALHVPMARENIDPEEAKPASGGR